MAGRSYPIPSRTRSSSSPAPMVLHGQPCGRVGRRRGLVPPRPPREALLAGVLLFSPVHFAQYPREIHRVRGFTFLPRSCAARRGQPPSRRSASWSSGSRSHAAGRALAGRQTTAQPPARTQATALRRNRAVKDRHTGRGSFSIIVKNLSKAPEFLLHVWKTLGSKPQPTPSGLAG